MNTLMGREMTNFLVYFNIYLSSKLESRLEITSLIDQSDKTLTNMSLYPH